MGRLIRTAGLLVLLATACADGSPAQPAAPSVDLFPQLDGGPERTLSSGELASDAFEPDELAELLEGEVVGAVERSYSGGAAEIRRVEVRVARFSSQAGASRYLTWLDRNDEQLIGDNDPVAALTVPPGASVRLHEPDGCCAKEVPAALTAWRTGVDVVVVTVSGPGVDGTNAVEVVLIVYRALERTDAA
jgi:hypothetical protein